MLLEQPSQYLAPSKGCAVFSLFFVVASLAESSAVFAIHSTTVFNMFPCIRVFSQKKTSVTGQQLALWLLTDLLFSLLEDLTSLPSDGFFCFNSAVIHKVAQCAIPMHIFHPPYQDWTTAHV